MGVVVGVAAAIHDRSYDVDIASHFQISGNREVAGCLDVWTVQSNQRGLHGHRYAALNVQILIANELGLPDTHQSYDMLGAVVSERCPVALASSALAFALASSSDALRLRLFFVSPLVVLLPTLLGTATVSPFSVL